MRQNVDTATGDSRAVILLLLCHEVRGWPAFYLMTGGVGGGCLLSSKLLSTSGEIAKSQTFGVKQVIFSASKVLSAKLIDTRLPEKLLANECIKERNKYETRQRTFKRYRL